MEHIHKILSVSLLAVMMVATVTSGAFGSVYADNNNHNNNNNNDKVKVDCNDVGIALATLDIALGTLEEDQIENQLEPTLEEAEIASSLSDIRDNLENVLDDVKDKCEDVDFIDFEFEVFDND